MKDPSFGMSVNAECKKVHNVDEHYICLDNFPPKDRPCIVYDFGIRDRPKFGIQMYDEFKCQVYAFDPSPVSVEWFTKDEEGRMLADKSYYHFYPYGAGGVDGNITLYEYSWQQVSNIHLPTTVSDDCENHGDGCKLIDHKAGLFKLPVKTLKTIMRDLNHTHVDILKLDIEGSEWGFMENILDNGCPPVDQISVEYHHFSFDMRYGGPASPEVNTMAMLLHVCGLRQFQIDYTNGGFPDPSKVYKKFGAKLFFNTMTFARGLQSIKGKDGS